MGTDATPLEELLQFVYLTPVGIVKFRPDGTVDLINPSAAQVLMPLNADGDLSNFYVALRSLVPNLRQLVTEFRASAGPILHQQRFETLSRDKPSVLSITVQRVNPSVYMAVLEDVTKLVAQAAKLSADAQRFRAIFDNVREYAIFTLSLDGAVEEWNQSLQRFGNWGAVDVEGRHFRIFFALDDDDAQDPDALLADALRNGSVETEGWRLKRDGSRLWSNMIVTALPGETGTIDGFVVVASDLTERKRMEEELKSLAITDPLTGAFNRRHGQACLTTESERRSRSGQSFAVLMLDIDRFKSVNDTYGHPAGDAALCALVLACKSSLRVLDVLARWGGEEFLILLPGTDADGAVVTGERLRDAIAAARVPLNGGDSFTLTVSVGIAVPLADGIAGVLRRADTALYAAKAAGRNQVVFAA